jgi:acetyltransferase-like isoleucine patch superfamily enzyme
MTGLQNLQALFQRFLIPTPVISLYYFLKFGAKVSTRAELELSSNIEFGPGCVVSSFSKFKATDGPLHVGARGGFATGCFVTASSGGIHIGNNFICGPHVSIIANNYNLEKLGVHLEDMGETSRGIRIGDNVWIGAGSSILDGAVIGDNTIVVANSLVNRRYPPNVVLQGCPARIIFKRKREELADS